MRRPTHIVPLVLLAAMCGLLAVLMQPSPARAASTETRVGASTSFAATHVTVATAETRALQPGDNATYDGVASGDLLTADTAVPSLSDVRAALDLGPNDTVARLDINGNSYYGINGGGGEPPPGVTFQTMRHAEGNAFANAGYNGEWGGSASLYVDRAPCPYCTNSFAGLGRSLGLDGLDVYGPNGLYGTYLLDIGRFMKAAG